MNVIPFKKKEEPHISGDAVCTECKHKWIAVAPTGTTVLECPSCNRGFGVYEYPIIAGSDDKVWQCNCDNTLFLITTKGIMCRKCGIYQDY